MKNGGKVRIIETQLRVDMKQYKNKTTGEIVEAKWESFYQDKLQPKHWNGKEVPTNLIMSKRKFVNRLCVY